VFLHVTCVNQQITRLFILAVITLMYVFKNISLGGGGFTASQTAVFAVFFIILEILKCAKGVMSSAAVIYRTRSTRSLGLTLSVPN
jgi:hypothetical protein